MISIDDFSPLRYPGSKQRIVAYIVRILSHNAINPDVIVEPFVGGGSVFLHFLSHGICDRAIISDKDVLVYCFWKTIFDNHKHLLDFIGNVSISLNSYDYYKKISRNPENSNCEQLAEACLFLNRTSFSGILADSAGPIGGRNQASEYKIDCRFNRNGLIDKIQYVSTYKNKVEVLNLDWYSTLKRVKDNTRSEYQLKNKIFFYLDPPFYYKAQDLYRVCFKKNEHAKLRDFLDGFDTKWILSYDNSQEIVDLYSNHISSSYHIQVPYSINSHSKRVETELVITPLDLPEE